MHPWIIQKDHEMWLQSARRPTVIEIATRRKRRHVAACFSSPIILEWCGHWKNPAIEGYNAGRIAIFGRLVELFKGLERITVVKPPSSELVSVAMTGLRKNGGLLAEASGLIRLQEAGCPHPFGIADAMMIVKDQPYITACESAREIT